MATWELSKENIQPLRSGRRVAALENQDQRYIVQKIEEFESEIRSYTGSDPLDKWYSYIVWVEQTFPKGGRDGNLSTLVEKCLKKFKDCLEYHQDDRFMEIWSKFANLSQSPLDIYEFMFNEGICTKKARFYADWAWELEQDGNHKRAEQVFKKGLQCLDEEQDKKWLESKRNQFQARFMKRLLGSDSDGEDDCVESGTEQRTALASLRGHGKHLKASSIRTGSEKKSDLPGVVRVESDAKGKTNNKKFSIFADENSEASERELMPPPSAGSARIPVNRERNRENDPGPGKWTSGKTGKKSQPLPIQQTVPKLSFEVHTDDDSEQSASPLNPVQSVSTLKVLKVRSSERDSTPVALFEEPDPMKKPMYCKHLVYMGGTEYSFEELRCLKYQRQKAEEDYDRLKQEILKQTQLLQQEKNELEKLRQSKESLHEVKPSVKIDEPSVKAKHTVEPKLKSSLRPDMNMHTPTVGPEMDSSDSTADMKPSSPTINTKEALNLMNDLWWNKSKPVGIHVEKKEAKPESKDAAFEIFCDDDKDDGPNEDVTRHTKKRFAVPEVAVINETLQLPSLELFARAAPVASTPFHGRAFLPEEDENTCAIQILSRRRSSQQARQDEDENAAQFEKHQNSGDSDGKASNNLLLSPIMEMSKENYKSSSSSLSTVSSHHTKSHFATTISSKTPASSHTPSKTSTAAAIRPVPAVLHMVDEMDEPTESLAGVLDEFRQLAGFEKKKEGTTVAFVPDAAELSLQLSCRRLDKSSFNQGRKAQLGSSFWQQSLKSSFIEPEVDVDVNCSPLKLDPCGGRSLMFSGSRIDQSLSVSMGATLQRDLSQPHLEETTTLDENRTDKRPLPANFLQNPFSSDLHDVLLSWVNVDQRHGYLRVSGPLPAISTQSVVSIAGTKFRVDSCKGQGGYGKVFKATKLSDDFRSDDTITELEAVLKVQKPAREWEFYVVSELQYRLRPEDRAWFMSIPRCYSYNDGTVFVSSYQSCTLLDICNAIRSIESSQVEPIALYFTIEMLRVAELLRQAQFIHADIKPENFLLQNQPVVNAQCRDVDELCREWTPCLQMIDFGISIDMKLLPEQTSFTFSFDKADSKCPEMLDGKPWTYQLDYFGVAATSFTLLHGHYIKLNKVNDRFSPSGSFRRWWNGALWSNYFDVMLNIPSCQQLPELQPIRRQMEEYFFTKYLKSFTRTMANIMIHHHRQNYS